jgi:hypothetical protein
MTTEAVETEAQEQDFEMILLAIMIVASVVLGYRNRDKIKTWFDDLIGKFK